MRKLFLTLLVLSGPAWAADNQALQDALTHQDYRVAEPGIKTLLAKPEPTDAERALIYQWLFAHDDNAEADHRAHAGKASVDQLAAGKLALDQHNLAHARHHDESALQLAMTPLDKANALRALGQVAYQQRDFDGSLKSLQGSLAALRTADALEALNETLIRLGRTEEAIAAAEEAVKLNPYHELAHYQLGNGYSRRNYTQMAAQEGQNFVAAMALVHSASDAFEKTDFDRARDLCFEALKRIPDLGRAHAILARTLEAQRFLVDVHRADYESRFAATPMPQISGIERYVINWKDLSPRHQKRVALSLAPWKAYIPVLAEGGATLFIKPMGMLLSEAPHMQALKDQRIEYDSRLWDDVRGAGGYNTVTGIEDVERTIFDRYNTVLHELSHQVQSVLPADQDRKIEALYQRAKGRDTPERMAFLSRYAGGSVYEYFAEGANAADSTRRDKYDSREMLLDRLVELDPDLLALERQMFAVQDVSANLPVALAGGAAQHLEQGDAKASVAAYERALKLAPGDERVQTGMLFALSVAGDAKGVNALSAKAMAAHPDSGRVLSAVASAQWHTGTPLNKVVSTLQDRRNKLKGEDRFLVDLAIADSQRKLGFNLRSITAYDAALTYQADSPESLWGKAAALAQAKRWDPAFAMYDKVLRLRTGLVPLRADRLRDTLRAGRLDQARDQLNEALLLDPVDPNLLALGAWVALAGKDAQGALKQADAALAKGPWCDLAVIIKGGALKALGRAAEAKAVVAPLKASIKAESGPSYVYRPEQSAWVSVHEMPSVERELLRDLMGD